MATTYDKASLVMIPSGYKDDKLYSIKPTDGSGDFTFSRDGAGASPATRVNASGLIEKGRENILLQSNTFSNATWTKSNISVTGGQSGYDGSSDAWQVSITSASYYMAENLVTSDVQTFSVYAKAGTLNWLMLGVGGGTFTEASFDLQNGVLGSTANAIDSAIESVGGGWYRCSVSFNKTTSNRVIYPAIADSDLTASSGYIYIQDTQAESGLVATDVIETTTTAVSAGLLGDMPRLDYSGGASCPSLLLEPSRTNLNGISEYYNGWTKVANGTGSLPVVTSNTTDTLSPEGVYNASKIVFDSGAGTTSSDESSLRYTNTGLSVSSQYTNSIWLKGASGGEEVILRSVSGAYGKFTLTTEWQRFEHIETCTLSSFSTSLGIRQDAGFGTINSSATIYAYGFQLELGSYPTSYIPTYGSASTRGRENNYKSSISSLIGQTEGTIFAEVNISHLDGTTARDLFFLSNTDNVSDDWVGVGFSGVGSNALRGRVVDGGALKFDQYGTISSTGNYKIALAYKSGEGEFYVNGVSFGTNYANTSFSLTLDRIFNAPVGFTNQFADDIKQMIVFPTRLTNAELAALTTL